MEIDGVLHEYTSLEGLQEDVLEVLVGDIQDEHRKAERGILAYQPGKLLVRGDTPLFKVERLLGVDLDHIEAETLAGLIYDTLKRVPGVGSTQLFGAGYAMRIWLDPDRLQKYALMPSDVVAAIQAQNVQVSAGQLGGLPQVKGQQLNATVTAVSRLQTVGQFENIILKSGSSGSIVVRPPDR